MAKFKLKRKTFAFLGIGNVAKNWKAAEGLWNAGSKAKAVGSAAKAIGTGALYTGAGVAGAGAIGAGVAANKLGGGDLLSGGEKSAKKMDFSE
jgi:hypothetical protein